MIVLRFGISGRLAGICQMAVRITHPGCPVVALGRDGGFRGEHGGPEYGALEAVMHAHPGEQFLVLDASVDHSSSEALVAHESFKRDCIAAIGRRGLLWRCVGFSSGIAMMNADRVRPTAPHMLEYRRQKLFQEDLFASLGCPIFVPRLFTLVGPRTFATQGTAWAQILRSRIDRAAGVVLNEPHARKAWASEFEVLRRLLGFLGVDRPESVVEPLVQGDFTLHEIACGERLPLPPIRYAVGSEEGWLSGDYLPAAPSTCREDVTTELVRAIAES